MYSENLVYNISHELNGVSASRHYYKGISQGAAFIETLVGTDLSVTVTMGGVDITDSCYANGEISIASVTGDIVVTASSTAPAWQSHVQQRPEDATSTTNLWTALTPENCYYAGAATSYDSVNGWNSDVSSITVPVVPGELIYASSFGDKAENGNVRDGIRVAFFLSDGTVLSYGPDDVHKMYEDNGGYIVAPENAVAVCIPLWPNDVKQEVYIGEAVKNHDLIKRLQQLPEDYAGKNLWNLLDTSANEYYTSSGWGNGGNTEVRSVTVAVSQGDKVNANSFGVSGTNGSATTSGIRVTWFLEDGSVVSRSPNSGENNVYGEFSQNGYLTAPQGAVAVNVTWWTADNSNYLYITE